MATLSNCDSAFIESISQITCRVESQTQQGTGVLIQPQEVSEIAYIITAKHCIVDEDISSFDASQIKISIPANTHKGIFDEVFLNTTDVVLFPDNDEIDCAIIVLLKTEVSEIVKDIPPIKILETQFNPGNCMFRGYPQVYGHSEGINIIDVKYSDHNVVTTSTSLSSLYSDSLYNCQGFSGSGLVSQFQQEWRLCGIVCELQEPFQRFKICDFIFLNQLLQSKGYPTIKTSTPKEALDHFGDSINETTINEVRKTLAATMHTMDKGFCIQTKYIEELQKFCNSFAPDLETGENAIITKTKELLELIGEYNKLPRKPGEGGKISTFVRETHLVEKITNIRSLLGI